MLDPQDHGSDEHSGSGRKPIPEFGVFVDQVVGDTKDWVDAQKEHTLLVIGERLGRTSGALMVLILLALLVVGALMMCTVALAIWLSSIVGNTALGFLCVGGLYLLLALLFYFFGKDAVRDRIMLHIINATQDERPV